MDLTTNLLDQRLEPPRCSRSSRLTRPDMMPAILLDYLALLHQKKFVLIEHGESTIDRTLEEVNRGHTYRQVVETIMRTAQKGIPIGVQFSSCNFRESWEEMLLYADRLSELPIAILKLHQLQIIKGTPCRRIPCRSH